YPRRTTTGSPTRRQDGRRQSIPWWQIWAYPARLPLCPPVQLGHREKDERGNFRKSPGTFQMWKKLSLRARLSLPMVAMIVVALGLGGIALQIVSPGQLEYESAQGSHTARVVADALNAALSASANPPATLDAFVGGLGRSEAIGFRRA